uniref:NADH-ubiquinone oxidoreductase chain 2 n=1 Tax=Othius laeviusculus TaxID=878180 RepID=A0A343C517_9COLE|nr:NADH dehydrogenase subunit 2 [Othius laeviusculus]
MIKFYQLLFFFTMILGTLISVSSYSSMGMWMGLEINLLSIIPLMNNSKNLFSNEASLKYFITQALASTILLLAIILISSNFLLIKNINNPLIIIFNTALLTKMGAAPFHFWFPEVMEGLSWMNCLLLLTWQKIAPMVLIMYNMNFPMFFFFIIITSMMVSGIMGLNQTSMRKIMAYSSINHIAWMISSMYIMENIWMYYFLIYTFISINIIIIFNQLNIFYMKQIFMTMNNHLMIKLFFIMNFLSLGGLPPFIGFLPKWLTIQNLIENNYYFLSFMMIILTLITLYYYMRVTFSTLMIKTEELNFTKNITFKNFWIMMSNFLTMISLVFCTLLFNYM